MTQLGHSGADDSQSSEGDTKYVPAAYHNLRGIWLAIIVLAGLVVALAVVVVLVPMGVGITAVMAMSGTAFAASTTLGITVRKFLDE